MAETLGKKIPAIDKEWFDRLLNNHTLLRGLDHTATQPFVLLAEEMVREHAKKAGIEIDERILRVVRSHVGETFSLGENDNYRDVVYKLAQGIVKRYNWRLPEDCPH